VIAAYLGEEGTAAATAALAGEGAHAPR
jgi:hypothetical protein